MKLFVSLLYPVLLLAFIGCKFITSNSNGGDIKSNGKVYLLSTESNSIAIMDLTGDKIVKTIPVGNKPVNMAFSPDKSILAVAHKGSKDVWLIKTNNDSIFSTISLPSDFTPIMCTFGNSKQLFLTVLKDRARRFVISINLTLPSDIDTLAILGHIGTVTGMITDVKRERLFITGEVSPLAEYTKFGLPGTTIDYRNKTVIQRATSDGYGPLISDDNRYFYINNFLGGLLEWNLENQTGRYIENIPATAGGMVYQKKNDRVILYRLHQSNSQLSVVYTEEQKHLLYPLPHHGYKLSISNQSNKLYVIHKNIKELSIFDLSLMKVVQTIDLNTFYNDILIYE